LIPLMQCMLVMLVQMQALRFLILSRHQIWMDWHIWHRVSRRTVITTPQVIIVPFSGSMQISRETLALLKRRDRMGVTIVLMVGSLCLPDYHLQWVGLVTSINGE